MSDDHLQRRAEILAGRVDALAVALRAGGVSEEAAAQLLSRASAAVLHALNLESLSLGTVRASGGDGTRTEHAPASYCLVFGAPDEPTRSLAAVPAAA